MIKYIQGDVLECDVPGPKILIHISNCKGGWGSGFVLNLSKKWKEPEQRYKTDISSFNLGSIQMVQVEKDMFVINMIAQTLGWEDGPPIKYEALEDCLVKVGIIAEAMKATVIGPKFGTLRAGGDWEKIKPLIKKYLNDLPVIIYEFNGETK